MGKRPSREGRNRPLAEAPDKTERVMAGTCCHCGADVSGHTQRCRHRYDHIDLPEIRPVVNRVELFGWRCRRCGKRYRAEAPTGMASSTPFGPGIRSLLAYLHHSHHVGFERLSRIAHKLFGLVISECAIANAFRRMGTGMAAATETITDKLLTARVIASDETTTRTIGITRARIKIGMANLAYNFQRLAWLEGRSAPAERENGAPSGAPVPKPRETRPETPGSILPKPRSEPSRQRQAENSRFFEVSNSANLRRRHTRTAVEGGNACFVNIRQSSAKPFG